MDYKKIYEAWLVNPYFDEETKKELLSIENNEKEINKKYCDCSIYRKYILWIYGK